MKLVWLLLVASALIGISEGKSFTINDDRFVLDGKPVQIISGRYTLTGTPYNLFQSMLERI